MGLCQKRKLGHRHAQGEEDHQILRGEASGTLILTVPRHLQHRHLGLSMRGIKLRRFTLNVGTTLWTKISKWIQRKRRAGQHIHHSACSGVYPMWLPILQQTHAPHYNGLYSQTVGQNKHFFHWFAFPMSQPWDKKYSPRKSTLWHNDSGLESH